MMEPNFDYFRDNQLREWLNRPEDKHCPVCDERIEQHEEYCSNYCENLADEQ